MVNRWKMTAVWMAAAAMLFLGGCSGRSALPEEKAAAGAETTAAAPGSPEEEKAETEARAEAADGAPAPEAVEAEEEQDGPKAAAGDERAADGPGAGQDGGTESGIHEIEAFAERIQEAVADKDMEALADLTAFPLKLETADGETLVFEDREEFLKQNPDLVFGDDLMVAVAGIDTATLKPEAGSVTMGEEGPFICYEELEDGSFGIRAIRE